MVYQLAALNLWRTLLTALPEVKALLRDASPGLETHFVSWLTNVLNQQVEAAEKDPPNHNNDIPLKFGNLNPNERWKLLHDHINAKSYLALLNVFGMDKEAKEKLKDELAGKLKESIPQLESDLGQGPQRKPSPNCKVKDAHQSHAGKESNSDEAMCQPNEPPTKRRNLVSKTDNKDPKAQQCRTSLTNTRNDRADMLGVDLEKFCRDAEEAYSGKNRDILLKTCKNLVTSYHDLLDIFFDPAPSKPGSEGTLRALQQAKKQNRTVTWAKSFPSPPESPDPLQTDARGSSLDTRGEPKSVQTHPNVKCDMAKLRKAAKIPKGVPKGKPRENILTKDDKEYFEKKVRKRAKSPTKIKCTKPMIIKDLNLMQRDGPKPTKSDPRRVRTLYDRWRINDLGVGFLPLYDIGWSFEELEVYSKLILAKHAFQYGYSKGWQPDEVCRTRAMSKIEERDTLEIRDELFFAEVLCNVEQGDRCSYKETGRKDLLEALRPLLHRTLQICHDLVWSERENGAVQV